MPMPAVEATDTIAIVLGARSPRCWRAMAIISAVRPNPTPCAARPASNTANGAGTAVATLPAVTMASVPSTTGRRRPAEPSRPSTGVVTAPASSVIVSVHCAAVSDTR